jgi:hypothetical protein
MKILMRVEMPIEPFNSMARDGTAGPTLAKILESLNPEAAYLHAPNGCRGATIIVNLDDPSEIPSMAEPFFLKFNARVKCDIAMSPQDLASSGLEELGKKWA